MDNDLVTLPDAAERLGVPVGTMRRWVRQGCPVAVRGRRGRGHAAMVCLRQVSAWRHAQLADERLAVELAASLPRVLAEAVYSGWREAEGPDKRRSAGLLAAAWYLMASATLDHLRERCPDTAIAEIVALPEPVERLRKIATND